MGKTVGIIGAGAWGTALASALAREGNDVVLWARNERVADEINRGHTNSRYLPGFPLAESLRATTDCAEAAGGKEFVLVASPSLYLASTVAQLRAVPSVQDGRACIGALTKGFVDSPDGPKLILETMEALLPRCYEKNLVYIAGPSHAEEVATGKLTGLVAASENPKNSIRFRELLCVKGIMAYSSFDVVGVQICAAAKNVIAVVFGSLDALSETSAFFGDNAASFLLAGGLNEIQTLGFALGATHPETFTSIAGVGDLDVTCRSKYGRNRRFGRDLILRGVLSRFSGIDDLIARIGELGYLPEGVVACKFIRQIADRRRLRLPICDGLYRILNKEITPGDFLQQVASAL
ncbi:NAD(P)H-dependent glycerol-3-phosphate dehydrogenase [Treponema endosymbiont of Eucomonympha sp.]|uniref:NAD(P)H-dependent glycerol-3-phosphate dehydrogenase n=1 Tax=Treponema endosymbiont of Eucomonympha sp. TaxID=1580831 RepID=UPI000751913E|nr:NAD(P)H-dependent glycerol-3-phosphate dehydrogenase [Treponema endosymbiont of Eucomonympha sp.]